MQLLVAQLDQRDRAIDVALGEIIDDDGAPDRCDRAYLRNVNPLQPVTAARRPPARSAGGGGSRPVLAY